MFINFNVVLHMTKEYPLPTCATHRLDSNLANEFNYGFDVKIQKIRDYHGNPIHYNTTTPENSSYCPWWPSGLRC